MTRNAQQKGDGDREQWAVMASSDRTMATVSGDVAMTSDERVTVMASRGWQWQVARGQWHRQAVSGEGAMGSGKVVMMRDDRAMVTASSGWQQRIARGQQ